MKIQENDENKAFDKDGVVWDLTTWIIFYSLLPWFAGEILSSQVVEFIGGPQEKWGKVVSFVLRSILEAATEENLNRALKWWLILPQALLRQSKRGGKKGQGAASVAAQFQWVVDGDWGKLFQMLESDKEARRRFLF